MVKVNEYESMIQAVRAANKLWCIRHTVPPEQTLEENMAFGMYLFLRKAIRIRNISFMPGMEPLIDTLQSGADSGFEYYMKDLDTAVGTVPFARLRNLYDFRNTPEEKILRSGNPANLLEAAVWCLLTTTTLPQAMRKAADLKGTKTDTVVWITGTLGVLEYGSLDLLPEWRDEKLEQELRKDDLAEDSAAVRQGNRGSPFCKGRV